MIASQLLMSDYGQPIKLDTKLISNKQGREACLDMQGKGADTGLGHETCSLGPQLVVCIKAAPAMILGQIDD
jgi:hypothetical protein